MVFFIDEARSRPPPAYWRMSIRKWFFLLKASLIHINAGGVHHAHVFWRLVVKVEVWLFSGKVWGPLPSGRHCIVCNSIYQINLFEKQNWIKPSFTTNVRQKLKALMQGLQQRGQEYTGSGTMRGHNNVGDDEMPMQFSSDWYLHIILEIFIFEESVAW